MHYIYVHKYNTCIHIYIYIIELVFKILPYHWCIRLFYLVTWRSLAAFSRSEHNNAGSQSRDTLCHWKHYKGLRYWALQGSPMPDQQIFTSQPSLQRQSNQGLQHQRIIQGFSGVGWGREGGKLWLSLVLWFWFFSIIIIIIITWTFSPLGIGLNRLSIPKVVHSQWEIKHLYVNPQHKKVNLNRAIHFFFFFKLQ